MKSTLIDSLDEEASAFVNALTRVQADKEAYDFNPEQVAAFMIGGGQPVLDRLRADVTLHRLEFLQAFMRLSFHSTTANLEAVNEAIERHNNGQAEKSVQSST